MKRRTGQIQVIEAVRSVSKSWRHQQTMFRPLRLPSRETAKLLEIDYSQENTVFSRPCGLLLVNVVIPVSLVVESGHHLSCETCPTELSGRRLVSPFRTRRRPSRPSRRSVMEGEDSDVWCPVDVYDLGGVRQLELSSYPTSMRPLPRPRLPLTIARIFDGSGHWFANLRVNGSTSGYGS
jgi:hypothetical protein